MTRLESGAVALKREWVPLDEMVGSALTRLEDKLAGRAVKVELSSTLPLLSVDPVLFEQVLINLLENAAKYTPAASAIEIAANESAGRVQIEVRDFGPGLPPGGEEAVFQKFYRGVHTGAPGSGLGLPICRAIVEAHGGTIAGENREGGGAAFRIALPLAAVPPVIAPLAEPAA